MNGKKRLTSRLLIAAGIAVSLGTSIAASVEGPPPSAEVRKLAVLLAYGDAALPTTAEALVQSIAEDEQDAPTVQLKLRLQNPESASLLVTKRLFDDYRATLSADDPDEILHRYVVLEFPDSETTLAAKAALEKDPLVLFVKESTFGSFSVAPADPLYQTAPVVQDYQWALRVSPFQYEQAWDKVRGTAYLAHLDNGIQMGSPGTGQPLHEDLGQAWRPVFTYNVDVTYGGDVDEHPETIGDIGGHGTHTAGIMTAATSQTSVPAGYPNPTIQGGAGVCWYCSLMVAKVSRQGGIDFTVDVPAGISWAASSGAQVMNMSFGGVDHNCPVNPNDPMCLAMASAQAKQIVIAAAAGNSDLYVGGQGHALGTALDFPANTSYTIAVGAIQSYSGSRGNLWTEEPGVTGFKGSSTGSGMETRGILAPGRDVLSTFYYGKVWNQDARCGTLTNYPSGQGSSKGPKYGICTGTSMATPHIAGIVGLLRTINPLATASQINTALLNAGDNAGSPSTTRGYGVPNVLTAVNNVLATTNRLTPLFSLSSPTAWDHFFTVVPQMARAATVMGLLPYAGSYTRYFTYGTTIAEYPAFPDLSMRYARPRAQVWVFTTHVNPMNPSVELMPLYRLSWKCGDPGISVCGGNPQHVSHFYTTILTEAYDYIWNAYYKFEGIEGYVYPLSASRPTNTTVLMRAYNPAQDDYAIFPQEEQANMANQGFTDYVTDLGYVYRNTGARPIY